MDARITHLPGGGHQIAATFRDAAGAPLDPLAVEVSLSLPERGIEPVVREMARHGDTYAVETHDLSSPAPGSSSSSSWSDPSTARASARSHDPLTSGTRAAATRPSWRCRRRSAAAAFPPPRRRRSARRCSALAPGRAVTPGSRGVTSSARGSGAATMLPSDAKMNAAPALPTMSPPRKRERRRSSITTASTPWRRV